VATVISNNAEKLNSFSPGVVCIFCASRNNGRDAEKVCLDKSGPGAVALDRTGLKFVDSRDAWNPPCCLVSLLLNLKRSIYEDRL
jgi:hypothetical protein